MRKNQTTFKMLAMTALIFSTAMPALAENAIPNPEDATITARVKSALRADLQLTDTEVTVETHRGIVKLTGDVDTRNQASEAQRVADTIDGVQSVTNSIAVADEQEQ